MLPRPASSPQDDARGRRARWTSLVRLIQHAALLGSLAAAALLTGCGGGGNDGSSNPNSSGYDPAKTTLHDAGLDVCSDQQTQGNSGLKEEPPGLGATRSFYVAKGDCNGDKVTKNTVTVFQFTSKDAVDAGSSQIKAAFPTA